MKKKCYLLILFLVFSSAFVFGKTFDDTYKVTKLSGTWDLYWNTLVTMPSPNIKSEPCEVPSTWKYHKYGYGTYCISLSNLDPEAKYSIMMYESPGTSANAYVNGKFISKCGTVSTTRVKDSSSKPWVVSFTPDSNGKVLLAIQVSNWVYRKAGLWSSVYFGSYGNIRNLYNWRVAFSSIAIGVLIFLLIVNIILFLLNHQQKSNIYFALVSLMMMASVFTAEFSVVMIIFPNFSYNVARKLEYLLVWGGPPCYTFLLDSLFPKLNLLKGYKKFVPLSILLIGVVVTFLPLSISCYFVMPFIAMAFIMIFTICCSSIKNYKYLNGESKRQLNSLFIILIVISTCLLLSWIITVTSQSFKLSIIPILFILFAVMQFLAMSYNQSKLFQDRIVQSQELKKLNDSYARFIPNEFLSTLNKKNVTEVKLGDHEELDMTILFIAIRSSGNMEKQFDLISDFSNEAVQIISDNHGYLSKFINKGIMALFPNSAIDAVVCSLELEKISAHFDMEGISTGIHFGKMIVGTIGEENRLDDTVISDTVNTAYRIMEYAKSSNLPAVVSLEVVKHSLNKNKSIKYERIGEIAVKGKKELVAMYSCQFYNPDENNGVAR